MKAREREPCFVPEEDQIWFDGQAFLHYTLDVVNHAIEGAVGQQQHLDPVELAGALVLQQTVLNLGQRHRAIHGVLVQRVRIQIRYPCARKYQSVVMRFVTITIDQHDITGLDQGLDDDFIGGRRAVGDEVRPARAKGARR